MSPRSGNSSRPDEQGDVAVEEETKTRLKRPRRYQVVLHNDDFTTMEFVVALLQHVFHHSESDAMAIMLHIHKRGLGIAGVYSYEIAEAKAAQVKELAEKAEFPLLCTVEPDEGEGDEE
jgi:ATP-dependent Clp protease adaptor protein ClpS